MDYKWRTREKGAKPEKEKWILECERQNKDPNYEDQNDDVSAKTWILIMRMLFQQNDGD